MVKRKLSEMDKDKLALLRRWGEAIVKLQATDAWSLYREFEQAIIGMFSHEFASCDPKMENLGEYALFLKGKMEALKIIDRQREIAVNSLKEEDGGE